LAFKSRLAVSSHIAAVLGQRSCGLFAIRFQTVQKVVDFIQRNPKLGGTLLTKRLNETFVWLRANLPHPSNHDGPGFAVRMTGGVPVYSRPAYNYVFGLPIPAVHHAGVD